MYRLDLRDARSLDGGRDLWSTLRGENLMQLRGKGNAMGIGIVSRCVIHGLYLSVIRCFLQSLLRFFVGLFFRR